MALIKKTLVLLKLLRGHLPPRHLLLHLDLELRQIGLPLQQIVNDIPQQHGSAFLVLEHFRLEQALVCQHRKPLHFLAQINVPGPGRILPGQILASLDLLKLFRRQIVILVLRTLFPAPDGGVVLLRDVTLHLPGVHPGVEGMSGVLDQIDVLLNCKQARRNAPVVAECLGHPEPGAGAGVPHPSADQIELDRLTRSRRGIQRAGAILKAVNLRIGQPHPLGVHQGRPHHLTHSDNAIPFPDGRLPAFSDLPAPRRLIPAQRPYLGVFSVLHQLGVCMSLLIDDLP